MQIISWNCHTIQSNCSNGRGKEKMRTKERGGNCRKGLLETDRNYVTVTPWQPTQEKTISLASLVINSYDQSFHVNISRLLVHFVVQGRYWKLRGTSDRIIAILFGGN